MGSCDPVIITGLCRFSSIKLSAEGRECHGVGAMQHHKSVEVVVILFDGRGKLAPMGGRHIRAVDWRIELGVGNIIIKHLHLWNIVDKMREIKTVCNTCVSGFSIMPMVPPV